MFCAACKGVLDYLQESGEPEGRWVHGREEFGKRTHVVVPVTFMEISEVAGHCDFCFAESPAWSVVCEPFTLTTGVAGQGETEQNFSSLWAACDECADLVRRRRWSALVTRVLDAFEKRHDHRLPRGIHKNYLKVLYSRVEANFLTIRQSSDADFVDDHHGERPS